MRSAKRKSLYCTSIDKDLDPVDSRFVFATHDDKVIKYLRRIIRLEDGKVVADDIIKIEASFGGAGAESVEGFIQCWEEDTGVDPLA